MPLPLPTSLSPSKVASFKDCALAFRFSAIDRVPEPPMPWAAKGTLVHRALELLYLEVPRDRTVDKALALLETATPEVMASREYEELSFADDEFEAFVDDSRRLVRNAFVLEDPAAIRPIGLELRMEAHLGTLKLRGIIDRLELDANGGLVVTDYKTGKVPGVNYEQGKLGGVHFYAFLVEQMLGRKPSKVQLLYLTEPVSIITEPTDQSLRGMTIKASAIWKAVEIACARDDFRPKPSRLCPYCAFQPYCPAFGGDPSTAPSRKFDAIGEAGAVESADLQAGIDALSAPTASAPLPVSGPALSLEESIADFGSLSDRNQGSPETTTNS